MKIIFHGAAHTVTGSQHLVEVNGYRLLLECGLYQGKRRESYERNRNLPFAASQVDAVILSHAHIDHSGNLPNLVKSGYRGRIYATPATAHLSNLMLMDSGHIQEMDAQYVNKKRLKRGEAPVEPIYTMEDAALVAQHFETVNYGEVFDPLPGVLARLEDAGHILGSANVTLDLEERGRKVRLHFSGDIGRMDLPLIRDPVMPEPADRLIMECTYGDKEHRDPEQAYEELRGVLRRTLGRNGKVIIPAFAVGRTQELVYDIHRMFDAGEVRRAPVIVDSPLAINASQIFRAHPECFDEETREFIRRDQHQEVFGFNELVYTRSVEDSKALNERKDPMIIISASGMAETGRILHHLKNNVEDARNTVLIVSWQAPHTLGRRLADRDEQVKIFGEVYERRAEVATIGGLSAHAGQDLLVEYGVRMEGRAKGIYLVHGEGDAAQALMGQFALRGVENVVYPGMHEGVEI